MADVAAPSRNARAGRSPGHVSLTLVALAVAGMVVSIQQTLVIPLLPRLIAHFHTSVGAGIWVFTASLLAGAVATPLLSRMGDMYGKKRLILLTMTLLLAGSLICAQSNRHGCHRGSDRQLSPGILDRGGTRRGRAGAHRADRAGHG